MLKHAQSHMLHGLGVLKPVLHMITQVSSAENEEAMYTAFTVTVDAQEGVSTGISASDRARTLRTLASPATQPTDLRRPGHICPLRHALLPSIPLNLADAIVGKQ